MSMSSRENLREIREAKKAGERALRSLANAKSLLNSAGNWGWVDMFGGGFLSGMMKHSKIDDANDQMEDARYELQCFQRELRDIEVPTEFYVNVNDFLVFADFFFDGVIADWLVQSKISEAKEQVDDAIFKVKEILHQLNQWESQLSLEG